MYSRMKAMVQGLVFGFVIGCYAVMSASVAQAAVVSYDEAINGDMTIDVAATVLNFDIGTNTVSGSSSLLSDGSITIDFDWFTFVIPDGTNVTAVSYSFSNVVPLTDTTTANVGYFGRLLDPFTILSNPVFSLFGSTPVDMFSASLPLGPGEYTMGNNSHGFNGAGISWDYTISFTVVCIQTSCDNGEPAPVPAPATLAFLGFGLTGIGLIRRRYGKIGQ